MRARRLELGGEGRVETGPDSIRAAADSGTSPRSAGAGETASPGPGEQPGVGGGDGKGYWRSLEELTQTPRFRTFLEQEFPGLEEELASGASRRSFLGLLGASVALAGLASCRWPRELILPYANRPEGLVPGVADRFATAVDLHGAGVGLVVTSVDGRPIKVEGNPLHPASLGAASALAQALVLQLYDPDRSTTVVRREGGQAVAATFEEWDAFAAVHFARLAERGGTGLAVLAEPTSSPSLHQLRHRFAARYPRASWVEWEPLSDENRRRGARLAFGAGVRAQLHLAQADVIVSIGGDVLAEGPMALAHARAFASRRRADGLDMNRLLVAESVLSLTGAAADHRVALPPPALEGFILDLAAELAQRGVAVPWSARPLSPPGSPARRFAALAARELQRAGGKGLLLAGPRQRAEVHALVYALNVALGHVGRTVSFTAEPEGEGGGVEELERLAAELEAGAVDTLVILGGNPAYDAPANLGLAELIGRCPTSVHLSLYDDETSVRCRWHLPRAHPFESWGDVRAWDGTVSVTQPLIAPLYGGRTALEVVAGILGHAASAYELVRQHFAEKLAQGDPERAWRVALADGLVAGTSLAPLEPALDAEELATAATQLADLRVPSGLAVVFVPDASVHDGRFANNAWLQEVPDPLTKLTWDNAALVAPRTAAGLGVGDGEMVRLEVAGRTLEVAAYLLPGMAEETVGLPLGYGRSRAGRVGSGVGFDTYRLRTSGALHTAFGVSLERTGRSYPLATTQDHHAIDALGSTERSRRLGALVREGTLAEYLADPEFARRGESKEGVRPLWREVKLGGEHQWAMSIDLSACIGCNACQVACQAENNIPVVGKRQVLRGREMHWIRVDRYFAGEVDAPRVVFQPVACQHCENAPCESVCPVAATVHSDEGLNQMVYNRCVGTRYCSNNCPFKVRRFNFFNYYKNLKPVEKMHFNPEVTVRGRGVMEKCTFCVQRIEAARIAAKNQRRPLVDGEIVPACAQTCPTQAIVFGDLADPTSRVARLHRDPRSYGMLDELFLKPRTRYLARLRNPVAGEEEA